MEEVAAPEAEEPKAAEEKQPEAEAAEEKQPEAEAAEEKQPEPAAAAAEEEEKEGEQPAELEAEAAPAGEAQAEGKEGEALAAAPAAAAPAGGEPSASKRTRKRKASKEAQQQEEGGAGEEEGGVAAAGGGEVLPTPAQRRKGGGGAKKAKKEAAGGGGAKGPTASEQYLAAIQEIPAGQTRTYTDVAVAAGRPNGELAFLDSVQSVWRSILCSMWPWQAGRPNGEPVFLDSCVNCLTVAELGISATSFVEKHCCWLRACTELCMYVRGSPFLWALLPPPPCDTPHTHPLPPQKHTLHGQTHTLIALTPGPDIPCTASLAGARSVGKTIKSLDLGESEVPWHRVVGSDGKLQDGEVGAKQLARLQEEGARPKEGECGLLLEEY